MKAYKEHFSDKDFLISFFTGLAFLIMSLIIQFFVSSYVTRSGSGSVTDIILSNTRVYDVAGIFVWGTVVLLVLGFFIAVMHINKVPFAMKSIALFTLIRAVFVSLTHISPFPTHILISSPFFNKEVFSGILTGNDLFFSGHTGIPFLLALMCWDNKKLRYFFLGFSVLFAFVVLLGHLHYSIDVLSAFFITYTIFDICKFFFKKDWQLFLKK
jgi:hypothetical protein